MAFEWYRYKSFLLTCIWFSCGWIDYHPLSVINFQLGKKPWRRPSNPNIMQTIQKMLLYIFAGLVLIQSTVEPIEISMDTLREKQFKSQNQPQNINLSIKRLCIAFLLANRNVSGFKFEVHWMYKKKTEPIQVERKYGMGGFFSLFKLTWN